MNSLQVELSEDLVTKLVVEYLNKTLGTPITKEDVTIEVKSKQNYRSEWEKASFRARVTKQL